MLQLKYLSGAPYIAKLKLRIPASYDVINGPEFTKLVNSEESLTPIPSARATFRGQIVYTLLEIAVIRLLNVRVAKSESRKSNALLPPQR